MEEKIELPNAKMIRKDAIINLKINTGMLQKIQQLVGYFTKDLTEEQIKKYKEEFPDYKEVSKGVKQFSEPWMYPTTTVIFLLEEIDKAAEQQGLTYEMNLEDYIRGQISSSSEED
jgi:hypothetical protein